MERGQSFTYTALQLNEREITGVVLTWVVTGNDAPPTKRAEGGVDEPITSFSGVVAIERNNVL